MSSSLTANGPPTGMPFLFHAPCFATAKYKKTIYFCVNTTFPAIMVYGNIKISETSTLSAKLRADALSPFLFVDMSL